MSFNLATRIKNLELLASTALAGNQPAITSTGDDTSTYKVLDGTRVRALRANGGTQISVDKPNGVIYITTPNQITGAGDGATNGQNLLYGSQIKALKGGTYIQLVGQGTDSVVIQGNSNLQSVLDSKQAVINVGGDDGNEGYQLLRNGSLVSICSSNTITPLIGGFVDGTTMLYFKATLAVGDISGLDSQLSTLAPLASPTFSGTTTVDSLVATSITLGGASVLNSTQSSALYAVRSSPTFTGTVSAPTVYVNSLTVNTAATFSGTVTGLSSASVGLGNVDNTSDLNKPISNLVSAALAGKQASLTVLGDDTSSYRLVSGSNVKGLVAGGYISLSQTASAVTVGTTAALDTALAGFLKQTDALSTYQTISGAASFISTVSNTTTDSLQNIKLTASGHTLTLDYSNLLTLLGNFVTSTQASGTYATILSVSSTYAPKASPTFTGVMTAANIYASAASNNGMVQLSPLTDGTESSIGFFRKAGKATTTAGDVWIMGQAAHGTAAGTFALGCYATGAIMTMQPTGATVFNYGVTCPTLSVSNAATFSSTVTSLGVISSQAGVGAFRALPTADNGVAEMYFCRKAAGTFTVAGDVWVAGQNSLSVGAGNFAIGTSVLGACLSIDTTGVVAHPYGITSAGLPVYTKPYIAGRINGATTGTTATIVSGGSTTNNAGQQLIATATRNGVGIYTITWTTAHPSGNAYGVYVTARVSTGWGNWGSPSSTSFQLFCYAWNGSAIVATDPADIAFMTIP